MGMVMLKGLHPGDIALLLKGQRKEQPQEFEVLNDDSVERGVADKNYQRKALSCSVLTLMITS